jgi:hypothetical protein
MIVTFNYFKNLVLSFENTSPSLNFTKYEPYFSQETCAKFYKVKFDCYKIRQNIPNIQKLWVFQIPPYLLLFFSGC